MNAPERVGLLVEGEAEYEALAKLPRMGVACPPLERRCCSGIGGEAPPAAIARRAAPHLKAMRAMRLNKVVFCLDLERRQTPPLDFAAAVRSALRSELGLAEAEAVWLSVVVANRAFEAWILADATGLHQRGHLKSDPGVGRFEGRMGAGQKLGKAELRTALGSDYRESLHGPRLFGAIELAKARDTAAHATGSESLDRLLRVLVGT